jgi:hypothetical protein
MAKVFTIILSIYIVFILSPVIKGEEVSGLTIYSLKEENELLIIDCEGKKLGYDQKTKRVLEEIEYGTYGEEAFDDIPAHSVLAISTPKEGLYTLNVMSKKDGLYWVDINAMNEDANSIVKVFDSIAKKGEVQKYEIVFSPRADGKTTMRKLIDISLIKHELEIVVSLKMIDKEKANKWMKDIKGIKNALRDTSKALETKQRLNELIKTLSKESDKYKIKNEDDVKYWYPDDLINILKKQNIASELNNDKRWFKYDNVKDERKREWLSAKATEVLLKDTTSLLESLK